MEGDYELELFGNDSEGLSNDSYCLISEWEPSYSLIPSTYLVVFVLGLSGNGLVIWTSCRSKEKRKSADAFIAHLAWADLTFVLTLPLWAAYAALRYRWPFGIFLCKLSSYMVLLNMYSSVFCLTGLSVDRYLAIVRSAAGGGRGGGGGSPRSRRLWLVGVWTLAGVLALPALVFRRAVEVWEEELGGGGEEEERQMVCDMDLSPLGGDEDLQEAWLASLSLSSTLLGFVLPFLVMSTCYCLVARTVSRHFHRREEERRRRRLLAIIVALVLVFAACWLPFHLLKTLSTLDDLGVLRLPCRLHVLVFVAHPYTTCLAYVNSCLNPFLYAFFDLRFRAQCYRVLTCGRFQQGPRDSPPHRSSSNSNNTRCEVQSLKV